MASKAELIQQVVTESKLKQDLRAQVDQLQRDLATARQERDSKSSAFTELNVILRDAMGHNADLIARNRILRDRLQRLTELQRIAKEKHQIADQHFEDCSRCCSYRQCSEHEKLVIEFDVVVKQILDLIDSDGHTVADQLCQRCERLEAQLKSEMNGNDLLTQQMLYQARVIPAFSAMAEVVELVIKHGCTKQLKQSLINCLAGVEYARKQPVDSDQPAQPPVDTVTIPTAHLESLKAIARATNVYINGGCCDEHDRKLWNQINEELVKWTDDSLTEMRQDAAQPPVDIPLPNLDHCLIQRWDHVLRSVGGQHPTSYYDGVLVAHRPSGACVVVTDERSLLKNREIALQQVARDPKYIEWYQRQQNICCTDCMKPLRECKCEYGKPAQPPASFVAKISQQQSVDPDIQEAINRNFMDLIEPFDSGQPAQPVGRLMSTIPYERLSLLLRIADTARMICGQEHCNIHDKEVMQKLDELTVELREKFGGQVVRQQAGGGRE